MDEVLSRQDKACVGFDTEELDKEKYFGDKALSGNAKAALKIALGSMLFMCGLEAGGDAFADTLSTIHVRPPTISDPPPGGSTGGGGGNGGGPVTLATVHVTAGKVKCEIESKNYDSQEYLGFVNSNSGAIQASHVVAGTDSVPVGQSLTALGLSASHVVAMVHNHPVNTYGGSPPDAQSVIAQQNRVPSHNDWIAWQALVDAGANPNIGQYIVGPDGRMRYFSPNDKRYPPSASLPQGVVESGNGCN